MVLFVPNYQALRDVDDVHEIWRHRVEGGQKGTKISRSSCTSSALLVLTLLITLFAMLVAVTWFTPLGNTA